MGTYLTTEEVAGILRTSPESVRKWRHENRGPKSIKIGRRVLYPQTALEAYLAAIEAEHDLDPAS